MPLQASGDKPLSVPRQLPASVAGFVGRARELKVLAGLLGSATGEPHSTVVISAIGGTAGVGKTALAVHWAHRVAAQFPDGQLYVDLRGFGPGQPMHASNTLAAFLRALGVAGQDIPAEQDERAARYRSLLADRRMIVVLDNARDEGQVRPLLPGGPGCLVLVTSRNQLAGLVATEGALPIRLNVLSESDAHQLLGQRIGSERISAEPGAAAELTALCARLPLALAVAAARASLHPGLELAALASELRDAKARLDGLDAADAASSLRSVFSWSTRQLGDESARLFRLLGLHPGPDVSVPAAASLAGVAESRACRLLRDLARAHLIAEHVQGRYAMHDLLRAYASEQAHGHDSQDEHAAAIGRVLDYYVHTAAEAALVLDPSREALNLDPPSPGAVPGKAADYSQALAWFDAEHEVLLAAVALADSSGLDSHAWQLPWAMASFQQVHSYWQEWAATQRTALAAATRLGDTAAEAESGRLLANACTNLGDYDQARRHYASSLMLYKRLGSQLGEARVHQSLGFWAQRQELYADALGHAEQSLRLYRAIGHKAGETQALNNVGWYHGILGDYEQARTFCLQALALCAETGHRWLEGYVWDSLGYAEHHLGNFTEAVACYQRGLSLLREAGDRFSEAIALTHLGDSRQTMGELSEAGEAWRQALTILDHMQHPSAETLRVKLRQAHSPSTSSLAEAELDHDDGRSVGSLR
jgi:tetratricopeptide (TPR) repeat protein